MKSAKLYSKKKIIWFLTVVLIVCFTVFETYSWGRYLFFVIAFLIYAFYAIPEKKFYFPLDPYQKLFIAFIIYTFLSTLWSLSRSATIQKGITLFQIFVLFSLIYMYYRKRNNTTLLLSAVKWSGFIIGLYTIQFYGIDAIIQATSAYRISNDFTNANTVGLVCALSIILQVYEILFDKLRISSVFIVPSILAIAASQSRKALVFVSLGCLLLLILKAREERKLSKTFKILIAIVIVFCVGRYAINNISIFSGISDRMEGMLGLFNHSSEIDHSTYLRNQMIQVGVKGWMASPFVGNGIGSTYILNQQYLDENTYLHNNYVEILCGGGLIGFFLYYSIFIYLIVQLLRLKNVNFQLFSISIIWICLMLIMDYGMVSYYSKLQWFYIMTIFLIVNTLKNEINERKDT